ncbi:MAG: GNAT family N-acetyltransferase, partial [Anaerolineae bacterium]|nr:GNAT family N-acetyltransferase [Anaerolineae bacterium]
PLVDISIACAVEDQMGAAFVDSLESPRFFMIEQDQFFCYFAGDFTSAAGREFLGDIPGGRFLMTGSNGWSAPLADIFGERLVPIGRYSHSAASLSLEHLKELIASSPHTAQVRRIDSTLANSDLPFVELGAYDSPDDFVERGIGYCLIKDGASVGSAYSSLVCGHAIEVSIFVAENHRRQGIATVLAGHLLQWCLEHHLTPNWDAANQESCELAAKLGFTKTGTYQAYFLKPQG